MNMPKWYYKSVINELKAVGYTFKRQARGSHELWECDGKPKLTVPRLLMSRHTANAIMSTAAIKKKF